jgi:hypothetical protein
MSNRLADGKLNKDDAQEVTEAMFGIEYCGDTELEVLLHHVAAGGRSPYTFSQIVQELSRRRVRDLVVTMRKCIDALVIAINRSNLMLSDKVEQNTVGMSIDDATYVHKLLSAHARNARLNTEQLRRLTRFSVHPLSLPAVPLEKEKV